MDMNKIYRAMKEHDEDLPKIALALLRRCDDCHCGAEREVNSKSEFIQKLAENSASLTKTLQRSIGFCRRNPNVQLVARIGQLSLEPKNAGERSQIEKSKVL